MQVKNNEEGGRGVCICTHVFPQLQTGQILSAGAGLGEKPDPKQGEQVPCGQGRCPVWAGEMPCLQRMEAGVGQVENCFDLQSMSQQVPCCGGGFFPRTKPSGPVATRTCCSSTVSVLKSQEPAPCSHMPGAQPCSEAAFCSFLLCSWFVFRLEKL